MQPQLSAPPTAKTIRQILKNASPELTELLLTAHEQKFRVTPTKRNHYKVSTPEHWKNQACAHMAGTPSEYRSNRNAKAQLKRLGVKYDH
jgi:hypothetical protein